MQPPEVQGLEKLRAKTMSSREFDASVTFFEERGFSVFRRLDGASFGDALAELQSGELVVEILSDRGQVMWGFKHGPHGKRVDFYNVCEDLSLARKPMAMYSSAHIESWIQLFAENETRMAYWSGLE